MKRIFALLLAAVSLISLTACAQPEAKTVSKYQLAAPQYPQMAQYPDETKFSRPNGDFDSDGFNQVYDAWQADRRKQMEQPEGYTDVLDGYLRAVIPQFLTGVKTFKADARRADKTFPMTSPELAGEVGAAVLEAMPRIKVDLDHPEVVVRVEIREHGAYIHAGQIKGAGGMPLGSSGRGLLLLSGGIDSPVAGYMMAKRGVTIEALHFESFPYTSERAKEKVLELAKLLCEYTTRIRVHVISLTRIQEEIRDKCDEDYFTLLLRRFMMTLAEKVARRNNCGALITGESLAQVASQTMRAIAVTDSVVNMPVFRPCIGLDKEEIVEIARKIGTFETSILPYEDCCTVFTPRHPRTRPEIEKVKAEESKLDFDALVDDAFATLDTIDVRIDD